jgi:CPA2 family monovalent cation:H+ antiporter-2
MPNGAHEFANLFVELGLAFVGLAILARLANRWGFSAIPLYLVAGLAFGEGGLAPLSFSEGFIRTGAQIGVVLLLFMLGLEYTGQQLQETLRFGVKGGIADLLFNFTPGLLAGWAMGWKPLAAVLLGGLTYISSSGMVAKLLSELQWMANLETPMVVSVLVFEDLAMAVYLPLVGVLVVGGTSSRTALAVSVAVAIVLLVLIVALRYGKQLSRLAAHQSDEIVLLTILGSVMLVAGVAQHFQVSAAIGAFLVGIAVSGPMMQQSYRVIAPLRDMFAATFFFFFGMEINPAALPSALPLATGLGILTGLTKIGTGWYCAARQQGVGRWGRIRAGVLLVPRGEFSIVIAGLGAGIEPRLVPFAAAYVLFLALLTPLLARAANKGSFNPESPTGSESG